MDAWPHILVLIAALAGLAAGWRSGFTGQVSGILGIGFGAVCAHMFCDRGEEAVRWLWPSLCAMPGSGYVCGFLGGAVVFVAVYIVFSMLTRVLRSAIGALHVGVLDSMLGAVFCSFKYLLLVSVCYNAWVCVNPGSRLMAYADADDGNLTRAVMQLAPAVVGSLSFDDFSHLLQLRHARTISCLDMGSAVQAPPVTLQPTASHRC